MKRLHSFDAFRAMLAIFGVILHSYYFYLIFTLHTAGTFDNAILSVHSAGQNFFGILSLWIHSFRMPAFFAISGFFSFYLFTKVGLHSTLMNRCKRILVPFLVLWLVPLILMLIKILMNHPTLPEIKQYLNIDQITYVGTFWFLYFLVIMDAIFLLVLIPIFRAAPWLRLGIQSKSLIILALVPATVFCALISQTWFTSTSISLIPVPSALIYYALFFVFGCLIASDYNSYSNHFRKSWPLGLVLSVLLIGLYWILFSDFHNAHFSKVGGEVIWGIIPWFMIVTLYGFFESLASKPNKIWRYLGDSSYWIYIAQMPIITILSLIFFTGGLSAFIAIPSVVAITLGLLLISYQLFIRKRRYLNYIDGARS